jgi:hypothetical protein
MSVWPLRMEHDASNHPTAVEDHIVVWAATAEIATGRREGQCTHLVKRLYEARGHHRYRAGWQPRQNPPYRLGLCAKNRGIGEKRSTARSNATVRLCSLHKFYPQLQTRNGPARLRTKSPLRFSIISMSHPCLTELPSPLGNARKIRGTNATRKRLSES